MTAVVPNDHFAHAHNALEVAEQEHRLALEAWKEALRDYDGCDPRKVAALCAAADRRGAAWDAWWRIRRGG